MDSIIQLVNKYDNRISMQILLMEFNVNMMILEKGIQCLNSKISLQGCWKETHKVLEIFFYHHILSNLGHLANV